MSLDSSSGSSSPAPIEASASLREPVAPSSNLIFAIVAGVVAMLVGTAIWVGVTVATNFQIGYMAVGVGFLVGLAMRFAGHGVGQPYHVIGAVLALLGCALGNLFTGCVLLAREIEVGFGEVLSKQNVEMAGEIMGAMFSPMDILFYVLAAMAGWKYSVLQGAE
jgi:hypothetical protein